MKSLLFGNIFSFKCWATGPRPFSGRTRIQINCLPIKSLPDLYDYLLNVCFFFAENKSYSVHLIRCNSNENWKYWSRDYHFDLIWFTTHSTVPIQIKWKSEINIVKHTEIPTFIAHWGVNVLCNNRMEMERINYRLVLVAKFSTWKQHHFQKHISHAYDERQK